MNIEKNNFGRTTVWAPILLEQFQSSLGNKIEDGKTFPFSSQIESSIPTFRDIPLHSLVGENFSLQLLA